MSWIDFSRLYSFGLTDEVILFCLIIVGIMGSYYLIRPLISILIALQSTRLLNYVISSLTFIAVFFVFVLLSGNLQMLTYRLFKFTLQGLAFFGIVLFFIHLIKQFVKPQQKPFR